MKLLFVFMTMMFSVSALECEPSCYRGVCTNSTGKCVCHTGWEGADCKTFQSCAATTTPFACSKDDECRAIDTMRTSGICCDSKCIKAPRLERGFACDESDPCSGSCNNGQQCIGNICQDVQKESNCQCTKDDDCLNPLYTFPEYQSPDKFCISGRCGSRNDAGVACNANEECKSVICENGECQETPDSFPPGASCNERSFCDSGLKFCNTSLNNGTCVSKSDVGGPCKNSGHCFNDLFCDNEVCVSKLPAGQAKNISGFVFPSMSCLSGTGETETFFSGWVPTTELTCRQKCCTVDSDCADFMTLSAGKCVNNKCSVVTASQMRSISFDYTDMGGNFGQIGNMFPKCLQSFEKMDQLNKKYKANPPGSVFDVPVSDQTTYTEFICCNICLYPEAGFGGTGPAEAVIDCSANTMTPRSSMDNVCSFDQKLQGPDVKSTCPAGGYVPDFGGCGAPVVGFLLKAIPIFVLFLNF